MQGTARFFLPLAVLFLLAPFVWAHSVGISKGAYRAQADRVDVELVFARPELASALPELDSNNDGRISAAELEAGRPSLKSAVVDALQVWNSSDRCGGTLGGAQLTEQDGVLIHIAYRCKSNSGTLQVNLDFLSRLSNGHRHLLTATDGSRMLHTVCYEGNSTVQFARSQTAETGDSSAGLLLPMFRLGILHILTGYDHLVFLLGLILVGGRLRSLLTVVTAFTVAHSITLCAAALRVWAPPPVFVEPAIALSIAYIGLENWFVKNAERRWLITFPFGLIHGFGFAGALREIAIPHSQIPLTLGAFNVGVEAGQIGFLLAVLPGIWWLRRQAWFARAGVRLASAAIAVAGTWWFIIRLM